MILIICLLTVKLFQKLLFSIDNSIHQVFPDNTNNVYRAVWFQIIVVIIIIILNKWLNGSIWPIDGTLTGTTTPNQSETESSHNEGINYIPQTAKLEPHY